jgi:hypothetical protein
MHLVCTLEALGPMAAVRCAPVRCTCGTASQRTRQRAGPLSDDHPGRFLDFRGFKIPLNSQWAVGLYAALSLPEALERVLKLV